jgi:8-oxo-dGTP pyrophosphatase MutT (NUDIX family)
MKAKGGSVGARREQAAAIPWRRGPQGVVEVLLASATGGGWTLPKGGVKRKADAASTAQAEAKEEAGAEGRLSAELGRFDYAKRGRAHRVVVFALEVRGLSSRWHEDHRRVRAWVPIERAPALLRRPQLAEMVRVLALRLLSSPARARVAG